jgi:hypothetical protein
MRNAACLTLAIVGLAFFGCSDDAATNDGGAASDGGTSSSSGGLDGGPSGPKGPNGGDDDDAEAGASPSGEALKAQWIKRFPATPATYPGATTLAFSAFVSAANFGNGDLLISGYADGDIDLGKGNLPASSFEGSAGAFGAILAALGPDGATHWSSRVGAGSGTHAVKLASGDVVVGGDFSAGQQVWGNGLDRFVSTTDTCFARIRADGTSVWSTCSTGQTSSSYPKAYVFGWPSFALDDGGFLAVGYSGGAAVLTSAGGVPEIEVFSSGDAAFMARYDANGAIQWVDSFPAFSSRFAGGPAGGGWPRLRADGKIEAAPDFRKTGEFGSFHLDAENGGRARLVVDPADGTVLTAELLAATDTFDTMPVPGGLIRFGYFHGPELNFDGITVPAFSGGNDSGFLLFEKSSGEVGWMKTFHGAPAVTATSTGLLMLPGSSDFTTFGAPSIPQDLAYGDALIGLGFDGNYRFSLYPRGGDTGGSTQRLAVRGETAGGDFILGGQCAGTEDLAGTSTMPKPPSAYDACVGRFALVKP